MRKVFKLQDLDCANCAAKMEDAIKKIDGVNTASMSFMTQKLVIDAEPEKMDAILDEAEKDLPQDRARHGHFAIVCRLLFFRESALALFQQHR